MILAMFNWSVILMFGFFVYAIASSALPENSPKPEETIVEVWPREDLVCYKIENKLISCERVGVFYE